MVDNLVKSQGNAERIAGVESAFGAGGQVLADPERVLVGEGVLKKICKKKPKSRQFFLFNDVLVYGTILINNKKYTQQRVLQLSSMRVEPVDDENGPGFRVTSPKKSFCVVASTPSERNEWVYHMNRFIEHQTQIKGTGLDQLSAAPVWVTDAKAQLCMRCNKTRFTTFNRRHHCRHCGYVVCADCSKKKSVLPAQDKQALRVCDTCYMHLSAGEPQGAVYEGAEDHFSSDSSDDGGVEGGAQRTQFYETT